MCYASKTKPTFISDYDSNDFNLYEQVPYFNNKSFQNAPISQQNGCEYCGGPHFSTDCQTREPFPCDNDYHDQPPQYEMITAQNNLTELLDLFKEVIRVKEQVNTIKSDENEFYKEENSTINPTQSCEPLNVEDCSMTFLDDDFFKRKVFKIKMEQFYVSSKIAKIRVDYDEPSVPTPSPVREMERETEVTKDSVLSTDNGSAKYVQPTVVQESIVFNPSRIDPNLSRFTVKSLSNKRAELKTVFKRNDLPNLHEQEPETITEVVEIPSSESTPLVPPPDSSKCFSRLESITPDSSHPSLTPGEGSDPVLEKDNTFLDNNNSISTKIVMPSDPLEPELQDSLPDFEKYVFDTAEEIESSPIENSIDPDEIFFDSDDDDAISCGEIEYVDEIPSELVSLEEENDEEVETEIQDEALRETLLNVNLLISRIEALKDPPTFSPIPVMDSDFFPELEIFRFEETSSGSPTIHADISLPDYERFDFEIDFELISDNPSRDPLLEDVDRFLATDDSIPPGIENDENDVRSNILSDLPSSRPPVKPPDADFEFGTNKDIFGVVDEISENDVPMLNILPTQPTRDSEIDFAFIIWVFYPFYVYPIISSLFHSTGSEDIVFDPGISIYAECPFHLLSPRTN